MCSRFAGTERARQVLRRLYAYFLNTRELPPEYLLHSDTEWRGVIDYIANMTTNMPENREKYLT